MVTYEEIANMIQQRLNEEAAIRRRNEEIARREEDLRRREEELRRRQEERRRYAIFDVILKSIFTLSPAGNGANKRLATVNAGGIGTNKTDNNDWMMIWRK